MPNKPSASPRRAKRSVHIISPGTRNTQGFFPSPPDRAGGEAGPAWTGGAAPPAHKENAHQPRICASSSGTSTAPSRGTGNKGGEKISEAGEAVPPPTGRAGPEVRDEAARRGGLALLPSRAAAEESAEAAAAGRRSGTRRRPRCRENKGDSHCHCLRPQLLVARTSKAVACAVISTAGSVTTRPTAQTTTSARTGLRRAAPRRAGGKCRGRRRLLYLPQTSRGPSPRRETPPVAAARPHPPPLRSTARAPRPPSRPPPAPAPAPAPPPLPLPASLQAWPPQPPRRPGGGQGPCGAAPPPARARLPPRLRPALPPPPVRSLHHRDHLRGREGLALAHVTARVTHPPGAILNAGVGTGGGRCCAVSRPRGCRGRSAGRHQPGGKGCHSPALPGPQAAAEVTSGAEGNGRGRSFPLSIRDPLKSAGKARAGQGAARMRGAGPGSTALGCSPGPAERRKAARRGFLRGGFLYWGGVEQIESSVKQHHATPGARAQGLRRAEGPQLALGFSPVEVVQFMKQTS